MRWATSRRGGKLAVVQLGAVEQSRFWILHMPLAGVASVEVLNPTAETENRRQPTLQQEDKVPQFTRLGDESVPQTAPGQAKSRGTRPRGAPTEDDDGGEETLEHFLEDVFGPWLAPDSPMDFEQITRWSQVRDLKP